MVIFNNMCGMNEKGKRNNEIKQIQQIKVSIILKINKFRTQTGTPTINTKVIMIKISLHDLFKKKKKLSVTFLPSISG